jgi:hypothetical protein
MAAWLSFTSVRFLVCFSQLNLALLGLSNLNQQLSILLIVYPQFKSRPLRLQMAPSSLLPKPLESQTIITPGDDKVVLHTGDANCR